ncbi:MAG: DUF58 domain-containing protein [Clostridia bacterium]|nr:DUF58 domain-containing protein [Clostridia bacterium]
MLKSRIIYSVIFLSSLYFVYFYGGPVPWAIFYIVVGFPVVSFAYLLISYFTFKYYESCPARSFIKGEKIQYKCLFANSAIFPYIYLKLYIQTPETVVTGKPDIYNESLVTGKSKTLEYEIECKYRGRYDIGILWVEFRDFLNLFELRLRKTSFLSVLIYPRVRVSEEFIDEGMTMSNFRVALFNKNKGDESLLNLREYAYGDSSKLIHWKLSARLQKLIVTDRESTFDSRVIMVIDLKKDGFAPHEQIVYEDTLIEDVVSTAHYFLTKNIPVDLVYFKQKLTTWHGNSMADFDRLYTILAEVEFDSNSPTDTMLYSVLGDENSNDTYFIFCTKLSRELFDNVGRAQHAEKKIFVRYCALDEDNEEVYNYHRLLLKQGITIERLQEDGNEEKEKVDTTK